MLVAKKENQTVIVTFYKRYMYIVLVYGLSTFRLFIIYETRKDFPKLNNGALYVGGKKYFEQKKLIYLLRVIKLVLSLKTAFFGNGPSASKYRYANVLYD